MPRRPRLAAGDLAYHVLNRRVGRLPLFDKPADHAAPANEQDPPTADPCSLLPSAISHAPFTLLSLPSHKNSDRISNNCYAHNFRLDLPSSEAEGTLP